MLFAGLCAVALAALAGIAFGLRYLLTPTFLAYHEKVLRRPWHEVEPRLQVLFLASLKVAGGGFMGYGIAMLWLLVPLSRGQAWASWAALTMSVVAVSPVLYVVLWVRRVEPEAKPPVLAPIAVLALAMVGSMLCLVNPS